MGNCIRPSTQIRQQYHKEGNAKTQQQEKRELAIGHHHDQLVKGNGDDDIKKGGGDGGGVKVKIVLTKEELEWLMFELKVSNGEKKLQDLLGEIERGRRKVKAWKPTLESILEIPEGLEKDR